MRRIEYIEENDPIVDALFCFSHWLIFVFMSQPSGEWCAWHGYKETATALQKEHCCPSTVC